MSDDELPNDAPRPARTVLPERFRVACPLCGFVSTAVRFGMEQEHLAAHLTACHVPDPEPTDGAIRS